MNGACLCILCADSQCSGDCGDRHLEQRLHQVKDPRIIVLPGVQILRLLALQVVDPHSQACAAQLALWWARFILQCLITILAMQKASLPIVNFAFARCIPHSAIKSSDEHVMLWREAFNLKMRLCDVF